MITTLEFVLRDKLALADRKRLRIQIAAIAFASPGVELRGIDPLAPQVRADRSGLACIGLPNNTSFASPNGACGLTTAGI